MRYLKNINFGQLSSFLSVVLLIILLTRIWAISLYYIFGNNPEFIERIISDRWHHYQIGLLLLFIAFFLRKLFNSKLVYAVGLGIFLEEWPVFLNDLGFNTNRLYHTKVDFLLVFGIIGFVYILSRLLARKYQHA